MKLALSLLACAGSAAALVTAAFALGTTSPAEAAPLALATPAPAPAPADYGTIKGRLVFGGEAPKMPEFAGVTQEFCKDQKLSDRSLQVDPKTKGVAHAFVYLNAPKGKNADAEKALLAKTPTVKVDNKDCEFVPRSAALHKAQTLEFTSSDPVGHNSHYTPFVQVGKNVALPPKGTVSVGKLQAEKRPIPLNCDIHPWMKGHIMVFDHPFFTVTGEDGSFVITGVPAGTQNIVVWHEKVGYVTENAIKGKPVEVKAGGTVDLGDIVIAPTKVKK